MQIGIFLTSSFPIKMCLISSSYLIALSRTSCTVLNKCGKKLTFMFQILTLFSMMLNVGLSDKDFIVLRHAFSFLNLLSFYHEGMLNFIKCIFYIYWDDHMFFGPWFCLCDLSCLLWFIMFIELSLHSWGKFHLVMCLVLLMCCWIQFASMLIRIFCICVHQWYYSL